MPCLREQIAWIESRIAASYDDESPRAAKARELDTAVLGSLAELARRVSLEAEQYKKTHPREGPNTFAHNPLAGILRQGTHGSSEKGSSGEDPSST